MDKITQKEKLEEFKKFLIENGCKNGFIEKELSLESALMDKYSEDSNKRYPIHSLLFLLQYANAIYDCEKANIAEHIELMNEKNIHVICDTLASDGIIEHQIFTGNLHLLNILKHKKSGLYYAENGYSVLKMPNKKTRNYQKGNKGYPEEH